MDQSIAQVWCAVLQFRVISPGRGWNGGSAQATNFAIRKELPEVLMNL